MLGRYLVTNNLNKAVLMVKLAEYAAVNQKAKNSNLASH